MLIGRSIEFAKSYEETGPGTPVFFILSPGVDPLKDVEALGKKLGFTFDAKNFHNISLGQGQEVVAEQAMDLAAAEGHWVVLQVCIYMSVSYTCHDVHQFWLHRRICNIYVYVTYTSMLHIRLCYANVYVTCVNTSNASLNIA